MNPTEDTDCIIMRIANKEKNKKKREERQESQQSNVRIT
jgi:hypothetical protein